MNVSLLYEIVLLFVSLWPTTISWVPLIKKMDLTFDLVLQTIQPAGTFSGFHFPVNFVACTTTCSDFFLRMRYTTLTNIKESDFADCV